MSYGANVTASLSSGVLGWFSLASGGVCLGVGAWLTVRGMRTEVVPATIIAVGTGSATEQNLTVNYNHGGDVGFKNENITVFPVVKFTAGQVINVRHSSDESTNVGTEVNFGLVVGGSTLLMLGFLLVAAGIFSLVKHRKYSRRARYAAPPVTVMHAI